MLMALQVAGAVSGVPESHAFAELTGAANMLPFPNPPRADRRGDERAKSAAGFAKMASTNAFHFAMPARFSGVGWAVRHIVR